MKKLLLIIGLCVYSFSLELDFKKTNLDEFKLYGMSKHIVYKNKDDRNMQIASLWEKFLTSSNLDLKKSVDSKIYVAYSEYKSNSFYCYIGIKSKESLGGLVPKIVNKSNYQGAMLNYSNDIKIDELWDEINKLKMSRDFKTDLEIYNIADLTKDKYKIAIYLSSK